jgi:hypothetical protein
MMNVFVFILLLSLSSGTAVAVGFSDSDGFSVARVQYRGGGDWYNDPSCIPNLARFLREFSQTDIALQESRVTLSDESLSLFPILFLTGHGRIEINDDEAASLREYLYGGGFLYADDDYGMDEPFRAMMAKVFPNRKWVELPFSHGMYHVLFEFPNGLPKIHEHDNGPPRGLGLFDDAGRLMVFYTLETNISDGWADPEVHHDPPEKRMEALRMGANIMIWALTH